MQRPPRPHGVPQPNAATPTYGATNDSSHVAYPHRRTPSQTITPKDINRAPAIFIVIILLQSVLIIYNSGTLSSFLNLESVASRASKEKFALMAERGGSERQREEMRHEREFWGKVPEDRVPQGAFWEVVWPAWDCRAYGKREYWGMLQNIPEGWSAVDACMNMPVEIKDVTVRRPYRCKFVDGSPHIHGYWMVDWDQTDCKPWYRDFHDAGCTSYRSGARRIEAQIVGIISRKEQDWRLMCESTPLVWNNINYTSPTHCEERRWGRKVAMWDVPDDSCLGLTPLDL